MTVELGGAGGAEGASAEGRPAASGSVLAGLRARREEAKRKLHIDLLVPRLDPPVYVRYTPVPMHVLDQVNAKLAESKDADRVVIAHAAMLAHACLGVFGLVDGKPEGTPNDWPRFDAQLAAALGLPPEASTADIVRGLYLTDGDILAASGEVSEYSALSERRVDEDTAGN